MDYLRMPYRIYHWKYHTLPRQQFNTDFRQFATLSCKKNNFHLAQDLAQDLAQVSLSSFQCWDFRNSYEDTNHIVHRHD